MVCFCFLTATDSSLYAADLDTSSPFWSGFYAGLYGGLSLTDSRLDIAGGAINQNYTGLGGNSPVGGIRAGYDFHSGRLVAGMEIGVALDNAKAELSMPGLFTAAARRDWTLSGSLRAGVLPAPNTLFYALGGISASRIKLKTLWTLPAPGHMSGSDVITGFHVGSGVEHRITGHLSINLQYRFINYREKTYRTTVSTIRIDPDMHEITLGLSWRF